MRILAYEFFSGGGLAGRDAPASLAAEGAAMRDALVADLAAVPGLEVVTTADSRFPVDAPSGVEVVPMPENGAASLDSLIASAGAAWVVAPETGGCLEALAARVERLGTRLIGPGSAAVRRAADKAGLARRLAGHGLSAPETRVLGPRSAWARWEREAASIGFPVVVKPRRGAGCGGVSLARDTGELRSAVAAARRAAPGESLLIQEFVPGAAASVSLLAAEHGSAPLAVNAQAVITGGPFRYTGGATPFDHPLAGRAVDAACRAAAATGGLRGYVGVDLVLADSDAVVIEINPRLTTAYLGVRSALGGNVAATAIAACDGRLPRAGRARSHVRFTSEGRVVAASSKPAP